MDKTTKIEILVIIVLTIILAVCVCFTVREVKEFNSFTGVNHFKNMGMPMDEEVERITKAEDVKADVKTSENDINLSDYDENVSIDKAGTYNLTGEFSHTLLIEADGEVVLNLNNITIKNDITSAIVNTTKNPLIINLVDGTVNNLTDGGSSDYNSCVYSNGALTIKGNGTLNVYGKQEEDEGIATDENDLTIESGIINIECTDDGINAGGDAGGVITINGGKIFIKADGDGIDSNKDFIMNDGEVYVIGSALGGNAAIDTDGKFEINGGNVTAIGTDMIQNPDNTSKQKSISLTFKEVIKSGTNLVVKDSENVEVCVVEIKDDCRTLILSNDKLNTGSYSLYNGDKLIQTVDVK